jgi:hypothetical protein
MWRGVTLCCVSSFGPYGMVTSVLCQFTGLQSVVREQMQSKGYDEFYTSSVCLYGYTFWRGVTLLHEQLPSVHYGHFCTLLACLCQAFILQETICLTLSFLNSFLLRRVEMNVRF